MGGRNVRMMVELRKREGTKVITQRMKMSYRTYVIHIVHQNIVSGTSPPGNMFIVPACCTGEVFLITTYRNIFG